MVTKWLQKLRYSVCIPSYNKSQNSDKGEKVLLKSEENFPRNLRFLLMLHWPVMCPMPIPKPAIGKVNGMDIIGLTSPGRHPQRACRDFTPPLKILATPYLNKIKILIAREKGRMGVEQASRRICTVIFFQGFLFYIFSHLCLTGHTAFLPQTVLPF